MSWAMTASVDRQAYVFCVLEQLHAALKRRDVFVTPSWLYGDPRAGLLDGAEWLTMRPIICRTLDLSVTPEPTLNALAVELDRTYQAVATRLPQPRRYRVRDGRRQEPSWCSPHWTARRAGLSGDLAGESQRPAATRGPAGADPGGRGPHRLHRGVHPPVGRTRPARRTCTSACARC